ncbi:LysE family translocator [Stackebrandtia nassauensis]|uniref:Lysine exporter protein (LYSE/YGGA) n=1 Tax=Stackebrandtia nassauensis (strain DSM 44728 / CIP 108903 / NRRL B-16338 / NBRC 102104 / LLR-40K-21) TaxID=446470 RepID=D3Q261_STANL|nr:LysE family translocator [Stackebrandtia nassauensis]ADD41928.1 Lysine exporter protein (LYSE/YGGA) [Stackebrandtia nassauensis DSM 44728]
MSWHVILTFVLGLLPITLTPGTTATLVVQYVSLGGRRHGAAVLAGSITGLFAHATFATLGLSALIMASATAFTIVKYAGAAYLVGLGVYLMFTGARRHDDPQQSRIVPSVPKVYRHALIANILNPRAALIVLTLPAQVVTPDFTITQAAYTLVVVDAVMIVLWLGLWTQAIASAKRFGLFKKLAQQFSRFGGLLLIALGIRTAVSN